MKGERNEEDAVKSLVAKAHDRSLVVYSLLHVRYLWCQETDAPAVPYLSSPGLQNN